MVVLIDKQAHQEQINQMLDALESYIKVVVDVERKTLAGGGEFHVDCEQIQTFGVGESIGKTSKLSSTP